MSSIPGYTLESFIESHYNLVLEEKLFSEIIGLFEPCREDVESHLNEYDEDDPDMLNWRDYSRVVYGVIPDDIFDKADSIVNSK